LSIENTLPQPPPPYFKEEDPTNVCVKPKYPNEGSMVFNSSKKTRALEIFFGYASKLLILRGKKGFKSFIRGH
jgi:hypothetical protein